MKPTIPYIREKFSYFNTLIFGGRLPEVPVTLCTVTSFVGQYKSKIRNHPDGRKEHYDSVLRFSTAFDLSERELEDTIIHEMIHYFIAYNGLRDRTAHGPLFKAMMQSINEAHGRAISISHRSTRSEYAAAEASRTRWHVVAVMTLTDGRQGVKVLPRVVPKIIDYYKKVKAAPNVASISLHLTSDPFFNRYPTSAALHYHEITPSDTATHLVGAHRLEVKGSKLLQK